MVLMMSDQYSSASAAFAKMFSFDQSEFNKFLNRPARISFPDHSIFPIAALTFSGPAFLALLNNDSGRTTE